MLTIYGVPLSVHTRKVLVAARLKGLEFTNEPVIPFDPPADWRSLSPTGLIPAIRHDDYDLADSAAICAYFERLQPSPALYPAGARTLGTALWLEQYCGAVLFRQVVHPLFHQKVIRPKILGEGEPDAGEILRITETVTPGVFAYLDRAAAAGSLGGDTMTIADLSVAANLQNLAYLRLPVDAATYPALAAAFARTGRHPAFAAALAAEVPFAEHMGLDMAAVAA